MVCLVVMYKIFVKEIVKQNKLRKECVYQKNIGSTCLSIGVYIKGKK